MFLIDLIIGYLFAIITQFINVFVYSKNRKIKSRNMLHVLVAACLLTAFYMGINIPTINIGTICWYILIDSILEWILFEEKLK